MSADDFLTKAKPFSIKINTSGKNSDVLELEAIPKQFARGSYGWICAGKVFKTSVAKHDVNAQVTLNMIVRGSHRAPASTKVSSLIEKFEGKPPVSISSNEDDGEWEEEAVFEDEFDPEALEGEEDGNLSNLSIDLPSRSPTGSNQGSRSSKSNGSPSLSDPLGSENTTENTTENPEEGNQWNCAMM